MFNWLNPNLFSQLLTGAIILETGLTTVLLKLGCAETAVDTTLVCTAGTLPSWTPAWVLPWLVGAAAAKGVLKWGIHLFQGDTFLSGLFKPTAIISHSGAPGTVTQKQVDSGPRK